MLFDYQKSKLAIFISLPSAMDNQNSVSLNMKFLLSYKSCELRSKSRKQDNYQLTIT